MGPNRTRRRRCRLIFISRTPGRKSWPSGCRNASYRISRIPAAHGRKAQPGDIILSSAAVSCGGTRVFPIGLSTMRAGLGQQYSWRFASRMGVAPDFPHTHAIGRKMSGCSPTNSALNDPVVSTQGAIASFLRGERGEDGPPTRTSAAPMWEVLRSPSRPQGNEAKVSMVMNKGQSTIFEGFSE